MKRPRFPATVVICILFAAFLVPVSLSLADHRWDGKQHFGKHAPGNRGFGSHKGEGRDHGNETTGQIAAWSLAAANLTVALSLLIKGVRRFVPMPEEIKDSMGKFNSHQKKYLMRFHYLLNPLIAGVALLHWSLSRCGSTALPEWGLILMCALAVLGIVLKFRLCPKSLLKSVYTVHTQPVLLLVVISVLVVGHLVVD